MCVSGGACVRMGVQRGKSVGGVGVVVCERLCVCLWGVDVWDGGGRRLSTGVCRDG